MATIGIQQEQITHILITHAHHDHVIGVTMEQDGRHVPAYPHAQVLLGRGDWEGNPEQAHPDSELITRLGTLAPHGLRDPVEGDLEVVPVQALLRSPGAPPIL